MLYCKIRYKIKYREIDRIKGAKQTAKRQRSEMRINKIQRQSYSYKLFSFDAAKAKDPEELKGIVVIISQPSLYSYSLAHYHPHCTLFVYCTVTLAVLYYSVLCR
jgi:hypothetical protein